MRTTQSSSRSGSRNKIKKVKGDLNHQAQNMTHTDFMAFIDPFYELVKDKNFADLKKIAAPKTFNLKKELYSKLNEHLKEKLCANFIFSDNYDIAPQPRHPAKLCLRKPIKSQSLLISLFERHDILKSYESPEYKTLYNLYEDQVKINNERRVIISNLIKKRIHYQGFCHGYDLLQHEFDELTKRNSIKKKKQLGSVDQAIMSEYINRMQEFVEEFGTFDQFTDNHLNWEHVFEEDVEPNRRYFA